MSYFVFIQRAVGSLQKCSLLYSTWHLELVIGRNQDWFHESNKGTQSEKHQLFRALQNYSTSKARKVPLQTLNKRCRGNSAWCRTRGTEGRPMKSRAMQTSITASALWCLEDCLAKTTAAGSSRSPQYRWDSTAEWEEEDLGETGWTLWISDDTIARLPQVEFSQHLDKLPTLRSPKGHQTTLSWQSARTRRNPR